MESESTIRITFDDGRTLDVPSGTSLRDVDHKTRDENALHILGAIVNNDVVSLSYPLEVDSQV